MRFVENEGSLNSIGEIPKDGIKKPKKKLAKEIIRLNDKQLKEKLGHKFISSAVRNLGNNIKVIMKRHKIICKQDIDKIVKDLTKGKPQSVKIPKKSIPYMDFLRQEVDDKVKAMESMSEIKLSKLNFFPKDNTLSDSFKNDFTKFICAYIEIIKKSDRYALPDGMIKSDFIKPFLSLEFQSTH